jgi:hypothetical protein
MGLLYLLIPHSLQAIQCPVCDPDALIVIVGWSGQFRDKYSPVLYTESIMVYRSFFFLLFLQLMLPEAPQPYGLLYYRRIGLPNFLHQFRAATLPKQRKLEL